MFWDYSYKLLPQLPRATTTTNNYNGIEFMRFMDLYSLYFLFWSLWFLVLLLLILKYHRHCYYYHHHYHNRCGYSSISEYTRTRSNLLVVIHISQELINLEVHCASCCHWCHDNGNIEVMWQNCSWAWFSVYYIWQIRACIILFHKYRIQLLITQM